MLTKRCAVTRATATEFRLPRRVGSYRNDAAFNIILQLEAVVRGRRIRAVGEASRRGMTMTGDSSKGSWRFLKAALARLQGWQFPTRPQRALAEIIEMMNVLGGLATETRAHGNEPAYRGTLAGLDIALVDLGARAADVSVADFLGGRQHSEPVTVSAVSTAEPKGQLGGKIAAAAGHGVVKLVDLDGREAALDALSVTTNEARAGRPMWVDLDGKLGRHDALKLVEALVDRIRAGELPPHIVLQRPIEASDHTGLAELQAAADDGIPHDAGHPGVVVMADVWSPADALALADGGVRGVDLNLQRLGGTLAVRDVVHAVQRVSGDVRISLSTVTGTFGIAARALAEVATALPALSYLELPDLIQGCDVLEPPLPEDQPATWVLPGDGPGLGGWRGLAPLVGYVRRRTEAPHAAQRPLTYGSMRANKFDVEPFRGFATLSWGVPLTNHLLELAALARGLNTMRLWNGVFVADHPDLPEPLGFAMRRSGWTGVSARRVADDKDLSRRMLQAAGVPTPRGAKFGPDEIEKAVEFALSLNVPVVVKPKDGSHGIGVATDLQSDITVRDGILALRETKYASHDFIVEEYISGNYYRFLVVGDRVVSVVLCRPASVVGDGKSTIVDLVIEKNLVRLQNPHMQTRLIELGRDAMSWLDRQGLTPDSVPSDGQVIRIGSAGNVAGGGDSIDVFDETDESMLDLAVRATRAVPGLDHCGVDLIGDHLRPANEQAASIIEVNSAPGTVLNHFPMFGTPRDVSSELILRSCELVGFAPPERRGELSVSIEAFGLVQGVGYRQWFARLADERGVVGSIRNLVSGSVQAYVLGATEDVAALASRAFIGPRRAFVERVVTTHVYDVRPPDRFLVH